MNALVTGGAGFIGSNLAERLIADGHRVVVYDNLTTGFRRHLESLEGHSNFRFVEGDLKDTTSLTEAMRGVDTVFHLAANADVRFGVDNPRRDLEQNTIGTANVLESARQAGAGRFVFASTSAIYGETRVIPTPEDAPFPVQTSLYAASKLAGEGLAQAYSESYGLQVFIFRYVSILGERYSHGHIFDFYRKLRQDPTRLSVLGNGRQKKSYLYVGDCIDGMLTALSKADHRVNIFNLGTEECCSVRDSIGWICERLGIRPELQFAGGDRGWVGDNPVIFLDCTRIRNLGWRPRLTVRDGVVRTLEYLMNHPWILQSRD